MDKKETDAKQRLKQLVITLTRSGERILNEERLKELKSLCKRSTTNVELVHNHILVKLNVRNAQTRYCSLQLMDVLFNRSQYFRKLVVAEMPKILELTVGINGKSLPEPESVATSLRELGIALTKQWTEKYGSMYKQLGLALDCLQHNASIEVTDSGVRSHSAHVREVLQKEARIRRGKETRLNRIEKETQAKFGEITENLRSLNICFEILVPKPIEDVSAVAVPRNTNTKDSSYKATYKEIAAAHGLGSTRYELTITVSSDNLVNVVETPDNAVVYENLRTGYKALLKHLKVVNGWLSDLMRLDVENDQKREALMKRAIDIKRTLEMAKAKSEELGVCESKNEITDYDDDSDFEEVELPNYSLAQILPGNPTTLPVISTIKPPNPRAPASTSQSDTVLQQPKIMLCRAPLTDGQLCPRHDLVKCPFHGVILPRDEFGVPLRTSQRHVHDENDTDGLGGSDGLCDNNRQGKRRRYSTNTSEARRSLSNNVSKSK